MYWCFNDEQLRNALRAYEQDRLEQDRASAIQTVAEKEAIRRFLVSSAAQRSKIVLGMNPEPRDDR